MKPKKYTIKITGGGTLQELSQALLDVLNDISCAIYNTKSGELAEDAEWENSILFTEIKEDE
jgi:hypothetical protein